MPFLRRAVRRAPRHVVRRGALAGAAVLALSLLAAACGSTSSSTSSSVGSASSASAGASGTLNWEWELPTSWDPVTSSAGWDVHALGLVYASITTLDPSGTVGPGLATSWKYAARSAATSSGKPTSAGR